MAGFEKGKWKAEKLAEFKKALSNSPLGKYQNAIDEMEAKYTAILDRVLQTDSVTTQADAENELKSQKNRKAFLTFVDKSMYVIDTAINVVKFHELPIDVSGSSMDDGNENLYYDIDKDELLFFAKSMLGDAVSLISSAAILKLARIKLGTGENFVGEVIKHVIDFGEFDLSKAILENHVIKVDYKDKDTHETQERKYILYKADKIFDFALDDVWSSVKADMDNLDRTIFTRNNTPVEFIWHNRAFANTNKEDKTLEFRTGREEEKIASVLKRVDSEYIKFLDFGSSPISLVRNYYANYGANAGSVLTDLDIKNDKQQHAAYAFKNLKGYALKNEKETTEYQDMDIYSGEHKNDRLAFFQTQINIKVNRNPADRQDLTIRNSYYDTATDIFIQHHNNGFSPVKNIAFVDGTYSNSVGRQTIYGYSNADTITATSSDNVYVEGGLGSDTIKTGSGNDIIYTNAHIDDKFDTEDESTTNTVNAGAGNDTIHGSNGIDIIKGEDGDDTIYGKKGDDILDGGKGDDWIYGGAGSDTISAEGGKKYLIVGDTEKHIYTHTDSKDGEDLDTENDTNTVNITNGTKNFIYGGKGNDIVTITGGENILSLDNGDNVVTITNSTQNTITTKDGKDIVTIENSQHSSINIGDGENIVNITGSKGYTEIATGKDKDEITISGGRKTGTNTDVNISSGAGADIIRISQNTTNHINAGDDNDADEIYGGSGYDYYFVANTDTLQDDGGLGEVWFNFKFTNLNLLVA